MFSKDLSRESLVVLTTDGKQDASAREFTQVLLKGSKRAALVQIAEADTLKPIVSNHASPQCIVKIQNDTLNRSAKARQNDIDNALGHVRQKLKSTKRLCEPPALLVEELATTDPGREMVDVVDKHIGPVPRSDAYFAIELAHGVL